MHEFFSEIISETLQTQIRIFLQLFEEKHIIVIWGKNRTGLNNALEVQILKIYYSTLWTVLHISSKQEKQLSTINNDQLLSLSLSATPFVNTLKNLKLVYLKSEFVYLIFSRK